MAAGKGGGALLTTAGNRRKDTMKTDGKKRLCISVTAALDEQARIAAAKENRTQSAWWQLAGEDRVKKGGGK